MANPNAPTSAAPIERTPSAAVLALVRLAALWVLAGAIAKACTGTPAELPAPIIALDIDPFFVIVGAIIAETTIALLALVAPRIGWIPLAALLAAFAGILVLHLRSGAESCGCFGGALPIPAWLVLTIDGSLLLSVILVAQRMRPWILDRAAGFGGLIGVALGLALAWYADARLRPLRPAETVAVAERPAVPEAPPSTTPAPRKSTEPAPPLAWHLPDAFPPQVILRPVQWLGKKLAETELGRWTDTSLFPLDATVIIYYMSCNHCADHLRELAEKQAVDPASAPKYVLVQLPTPEAYTGRLFVDRVPDGAMRVQLPKEIKAWVITPPWDIVVEKGVVKHAERTKWSGEPGAKPAG